MRLIVGLGNPGQKYERTRHNVGFVVADAFASKYRAGSWKHERDALTTTVRAAGSSVVIAKPQTYMNLSGEPLLKLARLYEVAPEEILVVYDDIDLPLGRLRVRENGSAGTHNGMRSIISTIGSDRFPRLRFGIRGETYGSDSLADYVLDDFSSVEREMVDLTVSKACEALLLFVRGDLKRAMSQFNRDPVESKAKEE